MTRPAVPVRTLALAAALSLALGPAFAQTPITPPKNKYTPEQDVKLGREAADEVRKQYPIIKDEAIDRYLTKLGDRLVAAAPADLKKEVYEFSFTPVNLKEINAFALPGGPMFVQRGMFEAAASEGEVVGVMAHELSHVLLRHGTANMTKAENPWIQLGQIAGIVGGAVVGGSAGSAISQGSQFGFGTVLLRYGRDFEKQADLLGSQIMAKAGYDPRDLAHMFETIQKESKGGSPQWMSSHPDPGNRTAYITKEAGQLTIASAADTGEFTPMKAKFASLPPAKSMADLARKGSSGGGATRSVGSPGQRVPSPATQYRDIRGGRIFLASVPTNWTDVPSDDAIKAVPQNGYGPLNGETVFTHGVEFGVARAASRDLRDATNTWLKAIAEGNPDLRQSGDQRTVRMSQRTAIGISLVNRSALGGQERIDVVTTFLADGNLFYYLTVVPESEREAYQRAFEQVGQSIRLTDGR